MSMRSTTPSFELHSGCLATSSMPSTGTFIDGLFVDGTARLPRLLARCFQPLQNGMLQSYAVTMAGGAVLIALLMLLMLQFFTGGAVS